MKIHISCLPCDDDGGQTLAPNVSRTLDTFFVCAETNRNSCATMTIKVMGKWQQDGTVKTVRRLETLKIPFRLTFNCNQAHSKKQESDECS